MATFIAKVQGARGEAHRLGHSIISADVNGWNLGVQVIGRKLDDGKIEFEIFRTGGSNGGKVEKIMTISEEEAR